MKNNIQRDDYLKAAQMDKQSTKNYFAKSVQKTEQQKALESLLLDSINAGKLDANAPLRIADLACGGGTLSFHLAHLFPNAHFYLLDYNSDGLKLAQEINAPFLERMEFIEGDLRALPFSDESFDLVFCWGVFLIFDEKMLSEIVEEVKRVLKPHGSLYASSLFNTEFDVDLQCEFRDLTRESGKAGIWGRYSTFSLPTMQKLLRNYAEFCIHEFNPHIDFPRTTHRGIATYSVRVLEDVEKIKVDADFGGAFVGQMTNVYANNAQSANSNDFNGGGAKCKNKDKADSVMQDIKEAHVKRLQISAGMLMNWGILEARK